MLRLAPACLLLLLFGLSIPALAEEAVTLRFDWPTHKQGVLTLELAQSRTRGGETARIEVRAEQRFQAEPHAKGLLIRAQVTDIAVAGAVGGSEPLQEAIWRIASEWPAFIVESTGDLYDLADLDAERQAIRERFGAIEAKLPEERRAQVSRIARRAADADAVWSRAAEAWNRDVGQWIGARFKKGGAYRLKALKPVAALNDSLLPALYVYDYGGHVPCREGGASLCAELHMTATLDEERLAPALAEIRELEPGFAALKSVSLFQSVTVITEPDTLIPHRVRQTLSTTVILSEDGEDSVQTDHEVRTLTYSY